ncbi:MULTISPECIES: DUF2997 domain-containing protein [unclassified Pseudomonas]|uniref:DUF2997 domain-containing protein n=1 Tax=unclassified Pseudomonas TaxID=196821 RepID=UPI000837E401|nr:MULTISPECIES: DUF2997 domain-containing protein [unclassified Pseudomonas]QIH06491.1 DUF2997 domain-containing protein [Pseudomonas sp. BIOMIG1BAC]
MSHCTKFEFTYTDEETIVKAFTKLGLTPTTELIGEYNILSKLTIRLLGYMGSSQFRAISAPTDGGYNYFACKMENNVYKLIIEHASLFKKDESTTKNLASRFQRAYISAAIENTMQRIEASGIPTRLKESEDNFDIEFGSNYEYRIRVTLSGNEIKEEVFGVKGDICTKLTEELESLLASPTAELLTEWKPEYTVVHEEQTLQILSARL